MSEVSATLETIKERTAYLLARDAECGSPDSQTSAGAYFLRLVAGDFVDAIEYALEEDPDIDLNSFRDEIGERADQLVPVYTHKLWETFVDLAAYEEDPTEYGNGDGSDMTRLAGVCLYMIADRLYRVLTDELEEAIEEDLLAAEEEE